MLIMNFSLTIPDVNAKISCHKRFSWLEIITQIVMVLSHSGPTGPGQTQVSQLAMPVLARGWGVPVSLRTTTNSRC